ncbi:MAG: PaaI family thioesterase [Actinobacteria bacterium]|nr:PaaI family thioesterase [Actinomycetota bacterium]
MSAVDDAVLARWNDCGWYGLTGLEVLSADEHGSRFRMTVGDAHLQAYGTAHGGSLAGLLDAAMGLAAIAAVDPDEGCATIEMKINFTAPVPPGEVLAQGRVLTLGRRIIVASAEATLPGGTVAAAAMGTFTRFMEAS